MREDTFPSAGFLITSSPTSSLASRRSGGRGRRGLGVHPLVGTLHSALVGVPAGSAGEVGLFGVAEGDVAVPLAQV